ncbi:glutaredoxin domain-containing cysteine-rich protein CG12206 [Eucalyptus grandis]|uniref:glutaredoxin domain-containing cysteine-rich protein CG12206 n=1 Tax=Eucalyptus grandis TaxID=71139 RepID=UPI00192F0FD5|nr:glutaredoxin domain-containing cysteine-rich protein CG12206 [Eucalyptus grandis]
MGCASSKRIDAKVDVYRPPPSSFAVFDINSIDEPWHLVDEKDGAPAPDHHAPDGKPSHVPDPILQKLHTLESNETPHSWVEVSKALEDLKTAAAAAPPLPPPKPSPPSAKGGGGEAAQRAAPPRKSISFHTLEELDAKLSAKPAEPQPPLRKTESMRREPRKKTEPPVAAEPRVAETAAGFKSVKNNIFVVRDRMEREKEGKMAAYERILGKRDPLSEFPEKCPPRGEDSLVIYTTSLRGVRRTYEDCARARSILEVHRAVFDERDVALHGEFLSELRQIFGGEEGGTPAPAPMPVPVPRVFLKGRYLGGVEELVALNESGRFGKLLAFAGVERGAGRLACEGCGGGRFVPCLDCGGSCKVVVEGRKERCGSCNENGLVHCPVCL